MVVFDTTYLLFLLQERLPPPLIPKTTQPIPDYETRIAHLLNTLQKNRSKIIVPTPVLAEVLVRADAAAPAYLAKLNKSSSFRIEPFDSRAAVEVALMTADALKTGDKRGGSAETWAKVRYDRQIIGIALANQIQTIYAHDENLRFLAEKRGLKVIGIHELDLPPEDQQTSFVWDKPNEEAEADSE
jgi:predicted nucleic acid-binding protein